MKMRPAFKRKKERRCKEVISLEKEWALAVHKEELLTDIPSLVTSVEPWIGEATTAVEKFHAVDVAWSSKRT